MRKIFYILLLVFVLHVFAGIGLAEMFPFGKILAPEKCYYDIYLEGQDEVYLKAFNEYEMFIRKKHRFYRGLINMEYPGFKRVVDDIVMEKKDDRFRSVFYIRTVTDAEGSLVRTEEVAFYHDRGVARLVRQVYNKDFREPHENDNDFDLTMKIPEDTYAPLMLDFFYRVADMDIGFDTTVHMISRLGMLTKLKIWVDETVDIETPLGVLSCYKITQMPTNMWMKHLKFFLSPPEFMVKPLMPKITFYYSVDKPHRLVHYYGYKDFGPANLRPSQAGLMFADYMDGKLKRIQPLGVDDLSPTDKLIDRLEHYDLVGNGKESGAE